MVVSGMGTLASAQVSDTAVLTRLGSKAAEVA